MKYALAAFALLFSGAAHAQQACPYAPAGQTSGTVSVSQTITINATPYQVIDCSAFQFVAAAAVDPMFSITSPDSAVIKLGVVDGANLAVDGVVVSAFDISELDVQAIRNLSSNGLVLTDGSFAVFDNVFRIGSIRSVLGNGILAQGAPASSSYSNADEFNVQGNHIEVGQIMGSNNSGIAVMPGAVANVFIVGPVEHNAVYGCYDGASASVPANLKNVWIVNGANSNGVAGAANANAAC